MKIDLTDQVALVTGASRGIGEAIALALGKSGARVIGTATTEAGAARATQHFSDSGIDATCRVLDISDPDSVTRLFATFAGENINPSILINNAGITRDNLLIRMKDEEWLEVINTNLNSVFRMSKLCLKGMMKARFGRIINISSVVALAGNPGQSNYSSAKAGLIGFTKSLAREVGGRGITVNAVAPGFIETDMTDALPDTQKEALLRQIALGRLGKKHEIADVVCFLASSSAAYITGETINVNGGMYMA